MVLLAVDSGGWASTLNAWGVAGLGALSGFALAVLKQRLDIMAERSRWGHDEQKRVLDERREAFGQYLAARPSRAKVIPLIEGTKRGLQADFGPLAEQFRLAAARLLIVLQDQGDIAVIEQDLAALETWLLSVAAEAWHAPQIPESEGAQEILTLARRLHAPDPGRARTRWVPSGRR